ncbi:HIT domain-containing protein [Candidatus Woesearchaeota archaeon]|nr:HIT domain-containing protein [Candidatus Woesearchaeota archaeon]
MADEEQCIFCHIANGKIPTKKVYEDDQVVAVLDINPGVEGHVLVLTKKHVVVMPQMDDVLVGHVGMVAKQLSQAIIRAFKCEGTSVFVANGASAGQRAPHFMLHVMPRKEKDGVALQPSVVRLDEKSMGALYSKLVPSVAKAFGKEPPKPEAKKEPKDDKLQTTNHTLPTDTGQEPTAKGQKPTANGQQPKSKLDAIMDLLTGGK